MKDSRSANSSSPDIHVRDQRSERNEDNERLKRIDQHTLSTLETTSENLREQALNNKALDIKSVKQINKRFLEINNKRLTRMRDALASRHRQILDALPILLHCNHPMMPGFVSRQTPHKICNFQPNEQQIQAGKTLARSFTQHTDNSVPASICSVFIMGSVGSIAQGGKSDLDIWLCHKEGLKDDERLALENKAKKITKWAAENKLEIHFFLMSPSAFKNGTLSKLDTESSGSAQHLLLLDEFYRSAIYLCGQTPLWWLVPNEEQKNYSAFSQHLLTQRFIDREKIIDFGGLNSIPAEEFIGASVWQLYKAIESPYKSALKLLLLEAYVTEHPKIQLLSQTFKQFIYDGVRDVNQLDGYLLIYRRIESYLMNQGNMNRLELARRCFYLKVNKPLSKPSRSRQKSWQRKMLEDLVSEWQWTYDHIRHIDAQDRWKSQEFLQERAILVSELTHSYRMLVDFSNFSGAKKSISKEELTVLGRKLNAAFDKRPGKIEHFNLNLSHDFSEDRLLLIHEDSKNNGERVTTNQWSCFKDNSKSRLYLSQKKTKTPAPQSNALKIKSSLVELMCWLYLNGVASRAEQFDLQYCQPIKTKSLERIFHQLKQWLKLPLTKRPHENFSHPAQPDKVLILLNATPREKKSTIDSLGLQRLSDKIDALNYGSFEENLIYSVDMIALNSWNELSVRSYQGASSICEALRDYLQMSLPSTHQDPATRTIVCVDEQHRNTITKRSIEWMNHICDCFYKRHPPSTRYIFQLNRSLFCLQFKNMLPVIRDFPSDDSLIDFLGNEQNRYSPIVLDPQALKEHPIRIVAENAVPRAITVFYRHFDLGMEIFVVDERGSLSHQIYKGRKDHNPLRPLNLFLRRCLQRQAFIAGDTDNDYLRMRISFFQLAYRSIGNRRRLVIESRTIGTHETPYPSLDVKATAWNIEDPSCDHDTRAEATISPKQWEMDYQFTCDDRLFTSEEYGDQIFNAASEFILSMRQQRTPYPIYISDLDLNLNGDNPHLLSRLQTSHYLRVKNALEFQLNRALHSKSTKPHSS